MGMREGWDAAKKSAKRELGLFGVMVILAVIGSAMVLPIIYVMTLLPDWTWWVWFILGAMWMIFGDTIATAYRLTRGDRK